MKGFIIIAVIFFGLSGSGVSQNYKNTFTSHSINNIHFNKDRQAFPFHPGLKELGYNQNTRFFPLHKTKINKTNSVKYLPVTVVSDDSSRVSFTYDSYGNFITVLIESKIAGQWVSSGKETYTYDNSGHILTHLSESLNSAFVGFGSLETYTLDNNGFIATDIFEKQLNGVWSYLYRNSYVNDNSGNHLFEIIELWTENAWVNSVRATSTFTKDGGILTQLAESWQNGAWVNSDRLTSTYDDAALCNTYIDETWSDNQWKIKSKSTYKHVIENSIWKETDIDQQWSDSGWINTDRYLVDYDSLFNMLSLNFSQWTDNNWLNISNEIYTYDNIGNPLSWTVETWSNNDWQKIGKDSLLYDCYGNCIHGESFKYINGDWVPYRDGFLAWYNNHRDCIGVSGSIVNIDYMTFTSVTNDKLNPVSFNLQQNYPNPFNPSTTINYSLPQAGNISLTVYNAIGSKVATLVNEYKPAGNYSIQFNGSNLASGIYLYTLESGTFSAVKKLILMK